MTFQLKSIKLGSAFKVGAVLSGVVFFIAFVPIFFFQGLILSAAMVASPELSSQGIDPTMLGGLGIAGICIGLVGGTIAYAVMGGIGALLTALAYNIVSGWVGGLEFDLKKVDSSISEKRKNDF